MATVVEVARACNVTVQRVNQLVGEGMPKVGRGQYELGPCMAWYVRYLQRALEAKTDPETRSDAVAFTRQRTRLVREQADSTAMRNVVQRVDLVRQSTVVREFQALAAALTDYAKTLPPTLAAECEGQDVAERQITLARAMGDLLDFGVVWRPGGARRPE
jgi:phage terminase Nu1 subunit (DNA packaging protein)